MKSRTQPFIAAIAFSASLFGCQGRPQMSPYMASDVPAPPRAIVAKSSLEEISRQDVEAASTFVASPSKDRLGKVVVKGGQVADATQVAAAMLPSFHRCKLRWSPDSEGEVQVSAKIGPVGEVRIAKPEAEGVSPMLIACVTANVAGAKFATPTGDDPTVVIPIRFARP